MGHWFEGIADYLGEAYLRYSFTYGTIREVDVLVDLLGLKAGSRVLDVGCGPGRHAHEFARRGIEVVGVDVSARFVEIARRKAPPGASFMQGDARSMDFDAEFDAAVSLCQGAFGLACGPGSESAASDPDGVILERIVASVRLGGGVALSAFSAYFQVRFLSESDDFDADTGVNREQTVLRDSKGGVQDSELWTTCFTPRELRLLADRAGLKVDEIRSVEPGDYGLRSPGIDQPEFLMIGHRVS